jgi:hypothetical protein
MMRDWIPRILAAGLLACTLAAAASTLLPPTATASASRLFPQTGHTVQGAFLDYWDQHGGVAQFGYPLIEEVSAISPLDGRSYMVQYFERAEFEAHPENQPPYDILLSQLGRFRYQARYPTGALNQHPNPDAPLTYSATGHTIGGAVRRYWESHGGLATLGYPLSDEFQESSDLDGRSYIVQYFERAVLEYHPENKPPYDVLPAQIGTFRRSINLARQAAAALPSASAPRIYGQPGNDVNAWPADTGSGLTYYSVCGAAPAPGVQCTQPMTLTTNIAPGAGALMVTFSSTWEQGRHQHAWRFRVAGDQAIFAGETGDRLPHQPT